MKWPRHYAAEIIVKPVDEWKASLEDVPEWCRGWVRKYLVAEYEKKLKQKC